MLPFRHQGVYLSTRVMLRWRARHEDEWGRQSNVLGLCLIERCWYHFNANWNGTDRFGEESRWYQHESFWCLSEFEGFSRWSWLNRWCCDFKIWTGEFSEAPLIVRVRWISKTDSSFGERKAPMTSEQSDDISKALWLFGYSNAGFRISDGNLVRSNRKPIATGNCNATMMAFWLSQVTYSVCARALRAHNHVRWPPLGV